MKTTRTQISLLGRAALCGSLLLFIGVSLVRLNWIAIGQEQSQSSRASAKQNQEPPLPPQEAALKGKKKPTQNHIPRPNAVGGPDSFGYQFTTNQPPAPTIPYNFIDISGTGTVLGSGDDVSYTATLGAPFIFYGTSYTQLQIATNGYISTDLTDEGSDLTNDCPLPMPPSSGGGGRIYPLHGDLVLNSPTGRILQQFYPVCPRANDVGGAAEACTIIEWDNAEFFSNPGVTFDFEVILYHTTNEIVVQIVSDPDTGTNTTTGIQNPAATSGLTVACNSTGSIPNNFAVAFIPPCPMISCPTGFAVGTTGATAIVNYPAPTGSPACGPITCTPASGSAFPLGTTTVTCAATGAPGMPSCSFNITVDRVTFSVTDPIACTGPGDALTGAFTLTNNGTTSVAVTTASVALPVGLVGIPGSGTTNLGTVTVGASTVTLTGVTLTPGQSVAVTYLAQVGDVVTTGTVLTSNLTVSFGGGPSLVVPASVTVNCPAQGPGSPFPATSEISDQKAGSVLIYNYYTSDLSSSAVNTRLSVTNTNPTLPIGVHLFFVDGSTCSVADFFLCLTANQTISFLASDFDPSTTGYVVAVATDLVLGCPVNFNFLVGDEFVKLNGGFQASLGAEAVAALAGGLIACNGTTVSATLNFDGRSYNRLPRVLAADSLASRADGTETLLVVNRIGGSLAVGADRLGTLFGLLYNDQEASYSFNLLGGPCQIRGTLSDTFPRTTPRVGTVIPAGRTGWMRLWSVDDTAILGAQLVNNTNVSGSNGVYRGGHNLHKLTFTTTASLTIPVFPPRCQ